MEKKIILYLDYMLIPEKPKYPLSEALHGKPNQNQGGAC